MRSSARDGGYTLVEMLAALLVLSLAFFGLTTATRVFGQIARASAMRTDQTGLGRRLELALSQALGPGPYRGAPDFGAPTLTGNAHEAQFGCGESQACRLDLMEAPAQLVISGAKSKRVLDLPMGPAAFSYLTADGQALDHFPAAPADRLAGLAVLKDGRPLAVLTLQKQQPDACDFDSATGDCLASSGSTP